MMKISLILGGIFVLVLASCAPQARILKPDSDCKTTVEGFYHVQMHTEWTGDVPVLLWKEKGRVHGVSGKILEIKKGWGLVRSPTRRPFLRSGTQVVS